MNLAYISFDLNIFKEAVTHGKIRWEKKKFRINKQLDNVITMVDRSMIIIRIK